MIEALDVVKENQGCQKLISEAKDYLLLKDRRSELYCMRARPRRSSGTCTGTKTDTQENLSALVNMLRFLVSNYYFSTVVC